MTHVWIDEFEWDQGRPIEPQYVAVPLSDIHAVLDLVSTAVDDIDDAEAAVLDRLTEATGWRQ